MTDQYVDAKIHEALKATGNDEGDAVKLLITWAVRDQALLLGLAKPYLKDLATKRVHARGKSSKSSNDSAKGSKEAIQFPSGKGEKRSHSKVPPPKTSDRQASVMHQIVAAFKKK